MSNLSGDSSAIPRTLAEDLPRIMRRSLQPDAQGHGVCEGELAWHEGESVLPLRVTAATMELHRRQCLELHRCLEMPGPTATNNYKK